MSSTNDRGQKRPPPAEGDDGGGKRPAVAPSDEEEDTCWLCLDSEHESGEPLRRDCSCRGSSGHAHLACLVEYASDRSQRNEDADDLDKFSEAWQQCSQCKQDFQKELRVELANEYLSFVERNYPEDPLKKISALENKLGLLAPQSSDPRKREEVKQYSIKILSSIVEYMKNVQSPDLSFIDHLEARVFLCLGRAAYGENTEEGARTAVEHYEKSLSILRAVGNPADDIAIAIVESHLLKAKSKCEGSSAENEMKLLESLKKAYKHAIQDYGQESAELIKPGVDFAGALIDAGRTIEAERLLTKLLAISKQAHGEEHADTEFVSYGLKVCKRRFVGIRSHRGSKLFYALRYSYEEDGKLLVQGPIASPRNIEAEEIKSMSSDVMHFRFGTPVVCNGLKELHHLNGKIGDVRRRKLVKFGDEKKYCYKVHFEEEGLGDHLVEAKFLRILFELPE